MCIYHFSCCSVFWPYSRSYSVHFSFFTFFSDFCHITCHNVFVSNFPRFSIFSHIPGPTVSNIHFPQFSVFRAIY
jgi:hypothetical protein